MRFVLFVFLFFFNYFLFGGGGGGGVYIFKDLALFNGLFQYCFKETINEASWDQYAFL